MSEKVTVISNARSIVSISIPDLKLHKTWPKKGAKVLIDKDVLEEAMFDAGVDYMFKSGLLYIKDMQTKIDLGLEPEGATTPQNIVFMSDEEKEEYMSSKKQAWQLKEALAKLSYEGKKDFCDYVIDNELLDSKKSAIIKEVCGIDTLHAIQMKQANEAE